MGVDFQSTEKITRDSTYYIATQDIEIDAENNGRHILPDIAWLIESIEKDGQKVACIVRKDGKRAMMVDGHNRWRAICEINKTRKPEDRLRVRCEYFRGGEADALEAGYIANQHNPLQPIDQGYFIARMMRFGRTLEQIAKICREDVEWCKKRLELVTLTPEAREAAANAPLTAAVALARLAAGEQRRFIKESGGQKITPAAVRKFVAASKPKAEVVAAKSKPSIKAVYDVLHGIASHDKYPDGLNSSSTKDKLCEWLMQYIQGE